MANTVYIAVTPSDGAPVGPGMVTAIFIPGSATSTQTVAIQSSYDSAAVTLTGPVAGKWLMLPWPIQFIKATGTTVTGMVACIRPGVSPSQPL